MNCQLVNRTIIAAFAASVMASSATQAFAAPFKDDWLMKIQTEEVKGQFKYANSSYPEVAKVTVKYCREAEEHNPSASKPYEMLWYRQGHPIGLERQGKFDLTRGESVVFQIEHKDKQSKLSERQAVANAILRLCFDAIKNVNAVVSISLPDESFDPICQELEKLNFVDTQDPADVASNAKIHLTLESKSENNHRHLYFY